MRNNITAGFLKESVKITAKVHVDNLRKIADGTFEYDGSMPKSCVDAMYKKKAEIDREVLEYLEQFPDDFVMCDEIGYGKEYSGYLKILNQ